MKACTEFTNQRFTEGEDVTSNSKKPYALVGSGALTATIWKTGIEASRGTYRFNIVRTARTGSVTQRFAPEDLPKLLNIVRVLAAVIADDGCVPPATRDELLRLAKMLDEVDARGTSRCELNQDSSW